MGLVAWIVLGLIAGAIASFLVGGGLGLLATIVLGIIGAVVGGFLAQQLGYGGATTGVNVNSIVIATIGAVVVILVVRALRGGRRSTL